MTSEKISCYAYSFPAVAPQLPKFASYELQGLSSGAPLDANNFDRKAESHKCRFILLKRHWTTREDNPGAEHVAMLRYRELCRIGIRWASRPSHCAAGKSTASRLVVQRNAIP
jgi:hypothetical protein